MQRGELDRRPDVTKLPLREAFVENLLRASLDGADAVRWPKSRPDNGIVAESLGLLDVLGREESLARLRDQTAVIKSA